MPYTPEETRSQGSELNLPIPLQEVRNWLIGKKVPPERASLAARLIKEFYSRHSLPTFAGSAYVAFGGNRGHYGYPNLWIYHFWPVAGKEATIVEMEQMNALTLPFSTEISRPLRPQISVQPKFFGVIDPSVTESLAEVFQKACRRAKIDCLGVCQL